MEKEFFYKLKELTGILFNLEEEMSGRQTNWKEPILYYTVNYATWQGHLPMMYGMLVEYHNCCFIDACIKVLY
jgi:hypothetical protein